MTTTGTPISQPLGLADALKDATWPLHKKAERTGIVAGLLRQSVSLDAYSLYLRNLHHVYEGIEAADEVLSTKSAHLAPFLDKKIRRAGTLQRDLEQLCGNTWRALPLLESTRSYRSHIDDLVARGSLGLLGHIYVRYLGDLNGGQMLKRIVAKAFDLDGSALAFYDFPELKDIADYRTQYRQKLNVMVVNEAERREILREGVVGFEANIALSMEAAAITEREPYKNIVRRALTQ